MKSKCAAVMVVTMVLAIAFAFARMQPDGAGTRKAQSDEEVKPIACNERY